MAQHHKLCHVLGGKYNLPHAQTHAIVLPYVLAFNGPSAPDAERRLAAAFDSDRAIDGLQGLRERLLQALAGEPTEPEDVIEFRRLLYGLYAVLRLHNAQEEEGAFSLVPNGAAIGQAATGAAAAREPTPGAGPHSDVSPGTDPGSRDRAQQAAAALPLPVSVRPH